MPRTRPHPNAVPVRAPVRSTPLTLLIKPVSGRCNLRCDYCFYSGVQKRLYPDATVMSGEVLSEMIRQYLSLGLEQSMFSWQGGEPTLAGLDFFKEAVSLMQRQGRGGQSVGNALQTNGILLDSHWAEFLEQYRFLVGVSIDGPRELHEIHRGRSFEKALAGARTCTEHGVEVNVLAVVNRDSEGRAREIYDFFREEGFRHAQFIPCVEPGEGDRRIAPFSVTPEGYGDFLLELFETWREDDEALSIRLFDSLTELAAGGDSRYCVISPLCAQYLVVEASGDIYPCDFFVREELKVGNLLEMSLLEAFDDPKTREFGRRRTIRPERCRSCRHWRVCFGGCLKDRVAAGGFDRPTYFCEAMMRFLDHAWGYFQERARRLCPEAQAADVGRSTQIDGGRKGSVGVRQPSSGAAASRRPGRNAPCPCGSGKKYKNCCGRRR